MAKFASRLVTENVDWKIRFRLGRQFHEKERLEGICVLEITAPYYGDRLRRQFPPSSRPPLGSHSPFITTWYRQRLFLLYIFKYLCNLYTISKISAGGRTGRGSGRSTSRPQPHLLSFPAPMFFLNCHKREFYAIERCEICTSEDKSVMLSPWLESWVHVSRLQK